MPVICGEWNSPVQRRKNIAGHIRIGVFIYGNRSSGVGLIYVADSTQIIPFKIYGNIKILQSLKTMETDDAQNECDQFFLCDPGGIDMDQEEMIGCR